MKNLFLALALMLGTALPGMAAEKRAVAIKLNEVVKRIRTKNYKVRTTNLKTYQAKTNIEKARADLLPKLTIWNIASIALNPTSIIDQITDIAPFLVPANWTRLEENKVLYKAEQEGYRALWSNEVHVAKTLYMRILFDQMLVEHIAKSADELERIHRIVKTHETFGGARPGTARDIEIKVLGLREDQQNLKLLISQEINELSYALALKADVRMELASVELPDVQNLKAMDYRKYEQRALSESPERKQYTYLLSTLEFIKQGISYSFFGSSPVSRNAAGGVFDAIPETSGVFSQNASIKIADAQGEILRIQRTGIEQTVLRQLRGVSAQYNSDLQNYEMYEKRLQLARESNAALTRRAQMGDGLNAVEFSENVRTRIQAETAMFATQFRLYTGLDRLQRITFTGDYAK